MGVRSTTNDPMVGAEITNKIAFMEMDATSATVFLFTFNSFPIFTPRSQTTQLSDTDHIPVSIKSLSRSLEKVFKDHAVRLVGLGFKERRRSGRQSLIFQ